MGWRECFWDRLIASAYEAGVEIADVRLTLPEDYDFNCDSAVTISDVWQAGGWLIHIPGDVVLMAIISQPKWANFLEVDFLLLGGWLSTFVSGAIIFLAMMLGGQPDLSGPV